MNTLVARQQQAFARKVKILESIDKLEFLSTSQIWRIHNLKSRRNTTRLMNDMKGFIHSYVDGESIYYLNEAGRKLIGSNKITKKNNFVMEKLMRNEIYIAYSPDEDTWINEKEYQWTTDGHKTMKRLITDAYFEKDSKPYVVEVDGSQVMDHNVQKMNQYRELKDSEYIKGNFPNIIWVTTNEINQKKLEAICTDVNIEAKIYTITELNQV